MADVITKLRINEPFRDGRVVFLGGIIGSGIKGLEASSHDYATRIDSGVIDAKYTSRFDDTAYYTA